MTASPTWAVSERQSKIAYSVVYLKKCAVYFLRRILCHLVGFKEYAEVVGW